jgi:hypothetical protein
VLALVQERGRQAELYSNDSPVDRRGPHAVIGLGGVITPLFPRTRQGPSRAGSRQPWKRCCTL